MGVLASTACVLMRMICFQVVADGRLTEDRRKALEEVREQMQLPKEAADKIIASIANQKVSDSLQVWRWCSTFAWSGFCSRATTSLAGRSSACHFRSCLPANWPAYFIHRTASADSISFQHYVLCLDT